VTSAAPNESTEAAQQLISEIGIYVRNHNSSKATLLAIFEALVAKAREAVLKESRSYRVGYLSVFESFLRILYPILCSCND
jgi:hypothetical protein